MKIKLTILAVLITATAFADSIAFDSAKLHSQIVNTANVIITAVPDVTPAVSVIKVVLIAIGSAITGWAIGFFRKKNAKK